MCGRTRCTIRPDDVPRACRLSGAAVRQVDVDRYRPSYNVSPGSYLPVLRREDGSDGCDAAVHCMKWGLVPSFTRKDEKPDHFRMFNARSESIAEKASFRRLVPKNRCLVAVEGFYEWKKDGAKKQPYYIHFADQQLLLLAALYDSWRNSEGEILYTFTILTTSSSSALQWLHDRMPVILGNEESTRMWLDGSAFSKFDTILKPYEGPTLVWHPVTPSMGKPSFDGPECIKEVPLKSAGKLISNFFSAKGIDDVKLPNLSGLSSAEPKWDAEAICGDSGVKAEPDGSSSPSSSPVHDVKPSVKRDYEDFLAASDSNPCSDEIGKPLSSSPAKKKAGACGRQPTLFPYFGNN
ncbi:hypothetical protein Dimus_016956 [Dionaea muscipula]